MAVSQPVIKSDLLDLYDDAEIDPGISKEDFADRMATIIKDAILSADINPAISTANGVTPGGANVPVTGKLI